MIPHHHGAVPISGMGPFHSFFKTARNRFDICLKILFMVYLETRPLRNIINILSVQGGETFRQR
jgi:hypothetical protein